MTTLSYARENIDAGIECLHALIGQKVALIAIKDIYFRELPEDLIQAANQNHIPILLFSGVNFEDIIFNVKNALLANNFNEGMVHRINNLFQTQYSPETTLSIIKAINPFFRTQHICCLCRPISGDEPEKAAQVDAYYKEYTHIRKGPLSPEQDAYTLVKYSFGILVIFSSNADLTELQKRLFALLQGLDLKRTDFRIGLSSPSDDLSQLHSAFKRASMPVRWLRSSKNKSWSSSKVEFTHFWHHSVITRGWKSFSTVLNIVSHNMMKVIIPICSKLC